MLRRYTESRECRPVPQANDAACFRQSTAIIRQLPFFPPGGVIPIMRFPVISRANTLTPISIVCVLVFGQIILTASAHAAPYQVGLAKIDITPAGPIRLSGFSFRQTESIGVRQHIYARAMAIRAPGDDEPAVLVTVDSI